MGLSGGIDHTNSITWADSRENESSRPLFSRCIILIICMRKGHTIVSTQKAPFLLAGAPDVNCGILADRGPISLCQTRTRFLSSHMAHHNGSAAASSETISG